MVSDTPIIKMQPLQATRSDINLFRFSWQNRNIYRSSRDVFEAFLLRVAIGRRGRRLFGHNHNQTVVSVRALSAPVVLHRGTADFQIFMALFEQGTYDVVRDVKMPKHPVIFDLGGNIGLATLRFSNLFPNGTFLIVEPDDSNLAVLRRNTAPLVSCG